MSGGGVASGPDAAPAFEGCLIAGNRATDRGGGIFVEGGTAAFKQCRIRANRSDGTGGGLSVAGAADAVLVNCLITGNIARIGGAGLGAGESSRPSLVNCTVTGNLALAADIRVPANGMGAGVLGLDRSLPSLQNCIVWGNIDTEIDVLDFSQATVGFSLVGADVVWPGPGNLSGDPLFVLPGHVDDGGTPGDRLDDTWVEGDYHLTTGSECIDAASGAGAPRIDIAGTSRPCQAGFDMGAFEGGNCSVEGTAFRRADANADGGVDLNDPVSLLFFLFVGSSPPPCLPAADADHSDRIDLADPVYILRFLFLGGEPPPEPFEACSVDPSPGDLHCADFAPCR
jgi:parallel beta helix pectate lyase-like protein